MFSFDFGIVGDDSKIPPDQRVSDTIAQILEDHFNNIGGIIAYWPINDDARRWRKFSMWHSKHGTTLSCGALYKRQVVFDYDTDSKLSVCLVYREDCIDAVEQIVSTKNLAEIWDNKA